MGDSKQVNKNNRARRASKDIVWRMFKYRPYRIHGERNPKFDKISGKLLDIKNDKHPHHSKMVEYFGRKLTTRLQKLISKDEPIFIAIVPSHKKGSVSSALLKFFEMVKAEYNVINDQSPLRRHTTIEKLSTGGERSRVVHEASIKVIDDSCRGHNVLLIDDICTTENSIKVCADLLLASGAKSVIKVVLAKTAS